MQFASQSNCSNPPGHPADCDCNSPQVSLADRANSWREETEIPVRVIGKCHMSADQKTIEGTIKVKKLLQTDLKNEILRLQKQANESLQEAVSTVSSPGSNDSGIGSSIASFGSKIFGASSTQVADTPTRRPWLSTILPFMNADEAENEEEESEEDDDLNANDENQSMISKYTRGIKRKWSQMKNGANRMISKVTGGSPKYVQKFIFFPLSEEGYEEMKQGLKDESIIHSSLILHDDDDESASKRRGVLFPCKTKKAIPISVAPVIEVQLMTREPEKDPADEAYNVVREAGNPTLRVKPLRPVRRLHKTVTKCHGVVK